MWNSGLEQSPAYFSRRTCSASRTPNGVSSHWRTQSLSHPRSIISVNSHGSRERSRERSTSPFEVGTQSLLGGEILDVHQMIGGRSRSSSPLRRKHPDPIWKRQMRTMLVEHSKFIWDIVSYISNLQAFFDFAIGCGIPSCIVQRAIKDNNPSDDDIS